MKTTLEKDKWYKTKDSNPFCVTNIVDDKVCLSIYRGASIVWVGKPQLEDLNPVEVESPHKAALERALVLKKGDRVKYSTREFLGLSHTIHEGEILEILGKVNDVLGCTYSFRVSDGNSWYHIYPSDLIWEKNLDRSDP